MKSPARIRLPREVFDERCVRIHQNVILKRCNLAIKLELLAPVEVSRGRGENFDDHRGIDEVVGRALVSQRCSAHNRNVGINVRSRSRGPDASVRRKYSEASAPRLEHECSPEIHADKRMPNSSAGHRKDLSIDEFALAFSRALEPEIFLLCNLCNRLRSHDPTIICQIALRQIVATRIATQIRSSVE